jgi:hypothetical protein
VLFTDTYATKEVPDDEKVVKLLEMGFERSAVISALKSCNGNENNALELLLSGA